MKLMTKYIFRLLGVFTFFLTFGLAVLIAPDVAFAQYHGAYSGQQDTKKKEETKPQYPKIFSSRVTSVQQTQKLDEIYDGLYTSLWNYAISDFNYQKQLYEQIANERFQITRYSGEFSDILEKSMKNLNENHNKMKKALENADLEYKYIRKRVRESDHETLDELWPNKIDEYKKTADEYFEMQHSFLKTYNGLVAFILAQGGGYYYESKSQALKFYKYGVYEYYGNTVDELRKITYEQIKLLKGYVPAAMDPALLK